MQPLSKSEAELRYGKIVDNKWEKETQFMVMYKVPQDIAANWINAATNKPTTRIYINKDMQAALDASLLALVETGCILELKTFDGCFNIRDVRGVPGTLSWHSYGLAIDLNAKENPLNKPPVLSAAFVKCFTDNGFVWGGAFSRKDGMHFQFGLG